MNDAFTLKPYLNLMNLSDLRRNVEIGKKPPGSRPENRIPVFLRLRESQIGTLLSLHGLSKNGNRIGNIPPLSLT
jgi:hypothetical protein